MSRAGVGFLTAVCVVGCASSNPQVPLVDMKFLETPDKGNWSVRATESHPLRVAIIRGAKLTYPRTADLLRAAETPSGGNPQMILRAGRALSPGSGVVVLATARSLEEGALSGSVTDLAVYQMGLQCEAADIDKSGDLRNCAGYFLRVGKTWPAEVYEVSTATVSVISEVGTARGRLRLKSDSAKFGVTVDGEFIAGLIEMGVVGPPLVEVSPGK